MNIKKRKSMLEQIDNIYIDVKCYEEERKEMGLTPISFKNYLNEELKREYEIKFYKFISFMKMYVIANDLTELVSILRNDTNQSIASLELTEIEKEVYRELKLKNKAMVVRMIDIYAVIFETEYDKTFNNKAFKVNN